MALECLSALASERAHLPELSVILLDGGSGNGSADRLDAGVAASRYSEWVTLLPLKFNGGFASANNQAIRRALQQSKPAAFVYLVNPGAIIEPNAHVAPVAALRSDPEVASAGSQMFAPGGWTVGAASRLPAIASEFFRAADTPLFERTIGIKPGVVDSNKPIESEWVTGASVVFRSEAYVIVASLMKASFLTMKN